MIGYLHMENMPLNKTEAGVEQGSTEVFDRIEILLERYADAFANNEQLPDYWSKAIQKLKEEKIKPALEAEGFTIEDLQGAPEWHALLDGTFPDEKVISPDAHAIIVAEIEKFLPTLEQLVDNATYAEAA